jgi:hypothetical protein
MTPPYRLLGNIDVSDTIKKLDEINWSELKVKIPVTNQDKDPVEMIILFSLPDKENLTLQKLIRKENLLNLFSKEIKEVHDIVKQYYPNLEPKRIVLNKFLAHKIITEHVDYKYHYENTVRTHIPIITNDRCLFGFSNTTIQMETGTVYEFNNNIPHAAVNDADKDRIHLIIDWGNIHDSYWGEDHYDKLKEHTVNQHNNFICGYYVNTDICDEIIDFFNNSKEVKQGRVTGPDNTTMVDKTMKDSRDCSFIGDQNLCNKYAKVLQECLNLYREKYIYCDTTTSWSIRETPNVQYYPPGGGYFYYHCERPSGQHPYVTRHLVFMTYLNDVTDAGETEFFYQKLKIKPEKGLTLIWPSDWTFTHRGVMSPTQEKYIVTGWLNFD